MNNYEWLMNMTYEQRGEWLEAEHADGDMDNDVSVQKCPDESCRQYADQGERAELPDCESDSREKLEAEVSNFGFIMNLEGYQLDMIHGWLDRQAAITERECRECKDALHEEKGSLRDAVAAASLLK